MLVPSKHWGPQIKELCSLILDATIQDPDKYQVGLTKIFFRAGMLAHLENMRQNRMSGAAIMIQKNLKAKYYRRKYLEAREAIVTFQSLSRAYTTRKKAQELRTVKAATTIQSLFQSV